MTTTENNKLIAEFMGWKRSSEDGCLDDLSKYPHWFNPTDGWVFFKDMQYHTSWDWLMPVVEKIESDVLEGDVIFTIDGDNVFIEYSMEYRVNVYGYTKLESVYKAVIDFIQWYWKQKS